jgi:hypothetical protein
MKKIAILMLFMAIYAEASIGYISAMRGDVFIKRDGEISRAFKGFKLENRDSIETTRSGKAQIIFNDKTVIRVGRSSVFEIENYLFEKDKKPDVKFKVKSGFFSAVTGKIGKISKDSFKLKTKTATIGIRGTHFQGIVSDESEDIACLKGEIFLEIGDRVVDVVAGEIVNIKSGIPSTPRKIQSVDIDGMEDKASLETSLTNIDNQLSAISELKDSDARYAAYRDLESEIENAENLIYSNLVEDGLATTSPTLLESAGGSVNMDLYTKSEVLLTDAQSEKEKLQAIQDSGVYDVRFNTESKTVIDVPTLKHWDGNIEDGKILLYSGNLVFAGDLDPNSEDSTLTDNGIQNISIAMDTLNRVVNGDMQYLDESIKFSDSGNGAVTSDTFLYFSNKILESSDYQLIFEIGYKGFIDDDSIYSKISLGESNYFTLSEDEIIASELIVGGFIADKVDEIDIYKVDKDSNNIFSWGYWAYIDDEVEKYRGGWIKPNSDVEITSAEKISEYKTNEVTATYSGDIFGTVENYLTGDEAVKMSGDFEMNFDFSNNKIDGTLEFQTEDKSYSVGFEANNQIGENSFSFDKTSSRVDAGDFIDKDGFENPEYIYGSGNFYGSEAENIGGGFTAGFENGDIAIGVINGSKSE